ncbi:ISKra4 family transposase [Streptomyces sp. NPDC048473]|uniref:ISKra4 family transposase n=1 Tax=unclassified Streptomyces TaxID=2593676 RepID=UPI003716EB9E
MQAHENIQTAEVFRASRDGLENLISDLSGPSAGGWSEVELEEHIFVVGRELQRLLLQGHLNLRAARETRQESVTGADGIERRSLEPGHTRQLATRFGTVTVTRIAYRAKGAVNLYPADAELNLSENRHSLVLRKLAVQQAVRGSFDDAHAMLTEQCGSVIGKRQIEENTVSAARDIDTFYTSRAPVACTDDTLLVITSDAKGVVMRPEALREATRKAAESKGGRTFATRLAGGEKQGRKRMATLAAVYDTDPVPRQAHDVFTLPTGTDVDIDGSVEETKGKATRVKGPVAFNKWLTGSIVEGTEEVITDAFDQADQRDPVRRRTWLVLVDGAPHQIDVIRAEAKRRKTKIHILIDIIHVVEYLWRATWAFHASGDTGAERWVVEKALLILQGRSQDAAAEIITQADEAKLTPEQRKGAETCVNYLTTKREFLAYGTALTKGWPIATGIIEGACRHLVGDRLDITGSRWGLAGAEAVLKLRALHSNGHLDDYFAYHAEQEHRRVHQARYQDNFRLGA